MRLLLTLLIASICPAFLSQSDNCGGAVALAVNVACTNTAFAVGEDGTADVTTNGSCFSGSNYSDEWFAVTGTGNSININISGTNRDLTLTAYTSCVSGQVGCTNIPSGSAGTLTFPSTFGVTYLIQIQRTSGNNTANLSGNICATGAPGAPPAGSNITCAVPNPICSGSPIVFTANTGGTDASIANPGNDYDCLFTSPNPSWYYLQIATAGNISIDITAGSDIDFEIWGPFASLPAAVGSCNSYGVPLDCSYSGSAIEQANVAGVTVGQIYVLLVTNYANTVQNITLNTAGGNTATTNCAIVTLSAIFGDVNALETDNGALLSWTTLSEQNTDHFDVMHSTNGNDWVKIGSQIAALNSSELKNYSFLDARLSKGNNYYKIVQYDLDNAMNESKTVSLVSDNRGVSIFPNPSNGLINISSKQTITSVVVNDLNGTIVYSAEASDKGVALKLDHLKKGTYFVNVQTVYIRYVERVVID